VEAAVSGGPGTGASGANGDDSGNPPVSGKYSGRMDAIRDRLALPGRRGGAAPRDSAGSDGGTGPPRRRTDLRLALPAAMVWGASLAGLWLTPTALAVLCLGLAALGALLLARLSGRTPAVRPQGRRSFRATSAIALLLAAAAAAHSSVAASQRFDGPLAEAIAGGKTAVVLVEVAGAPRPLGRPGLAGPPERWSVPVLTREVATGGVVLRTRAQLVVMGGGAWGTLVPGQAVRATGKLRPADPGRYEAGTLAASSAPGPADGGSGLESAAKDLRSRFVRAAAFLAPDAAGLLPGMVTGDTSALDEGLENAMKAVGMTHLTAVSGANCSLVLGALLLACRRMRMPRAPAAGAALAGLGLFVVLVGPDASVLRAAVMGAVAVAALAGGRRGRGLSFLCLAVLGLLLADPGLGGSFGFLLSVLATLGIIVLGRRIIDWIPARIPRWAAGAVAVPLSAQLLCGPVIVLLQPQFSTYSLLANVAASPLVAPVTLLGTAAVPLVVLAPWPATFLIAVAGTFSAGVAGIARFSSQLPGASLPWPEGLPGLLSMLLLSALTFSLTWAAARPRAVVCLVRAAHRITVSLLALPERRRAAWDRRHGFDHGAGHGRLGYSTKYSGRDPRWPLRKNEQPVRRRRTLPPGARQPRRPLSSSRAPRSTWASGPWTTSDRRSAPPLPMWRSAGSTPPPTRPEAY
jgi:competence protein ComEC